MRLTRVRALRAYPHFRPYYYEVLERTIGNVQANLDISDAFGWELIIYIRDIASSKVLLRR